MTRLVAHRRLDARNRLDDERGAASSTSIPAAVGSLTRQLGSDSIVGDPSGVDRRVDLRGRATATSKRPAATPRVASSTATTTAGPRSAARPSSIRCPTSGWRCRPCATQVDADMRPRTLSFDRVVATTVWLLDHTLIRVGNRGVQRHLVRTHVVAQQTRRAAAASSASSLRRQVGTAARRHHPRPASRAGGSRCQELPGQRLLQYLDGDDVRPVGSRDVNSYIRQATPRTSPSRRSARGEPRPTQLSLLATLEPPPTQGQANADAREVVRETAALLRNTPAVCRKSYIHPAVLEAYASGELHKTAASRRGAAMARAAGASAARVARLTDRHGGEVQGSVGKSRRVLAARASRKVPAGSPSSRSGAARSSTTNSLVNGKSLP